MAGRTGARAGCGDLSWCVHGGQCRQRLYRGAIAVLRPAGARLVHGDQTGWRRIRHQLPAGGLVRNLLCRRTGGFRNAPRQRSVAALRVAPRHHVCGCHHLRDAPPVQAGPLRMATRARAAGGFSGFAHSRDRSRPRAAAADAGDGLRSFRCARPAGSGAVVTPTVKVNPVFAVPFGEARLASCERLNGELEALFLQRENDEYKNPPPSHTPQAETFESRFNVFLWPEPCVQELRRFMLDTIARTVIETTNLQPAD